MSEQKTIWFFDNNRRAERDASGRVIWMSHWREVAVASETRMSFILARSVWHIGRDVIRVPKDQSKRSPHFALSYADVLAAAHRELIRQVVEQDRRRLYDMLLHDPEMRARVLHWLDIDPDEAIKTMTGEWL